MIAKRSIFTHTELKGMYKHVGNKRQFSAFFMPLVSE